MARIAKMTEEGRRRPVEELRPAPSRSGRSSPSSTDPRPDETAGRGTRHEASLAGEQGKGFAVVADRSRKLAERTGQATKDIANRIGAIQRASEESAKAIKRASGEVTNGVGLAKEASASMGSIVEASTGAGDIVHRIAAATEQQSTGLRGGGGRYAEMRTSPRSRQGGGRTAGRGSMCSAGDLAGLPVELRDKGRSSRGRRGGGGPVKKAVGLIRSRGGRRPSRRSTTRTGNGCTNRYLYGVSSTT
jgi:gas vesicle protein